MVARKGPLSMGFFQARKVKWVAISFSRGSFRPRNRARVSCVSCTTGGILLSNHQLNPHHFSTTLLPSPQGQSPSLSGSSINSPLSLKYSFKNVVCLDFLSAFCCFLEFIFPFLEFIFLREPHGSLLVASFHFIVISHQGSLTVAILNSLKFPSSLNTVPRINCLPASQHRHLPDRQHCGKWLR